MNSKAEVLAPVGNDGDRSFTFTWNDDVLMEVLLWLPAKSIIRFKLVCKHWLSLFSSDKFCHLHTLRRPKLQPSLILKAPTTHFFYFNPISDCEKLLIPYSFPGPRNPETGSSCNGEMQLQSDYLEQSFYNVPKIEGERPMKHISTLTIRSSCNGLMLLQSRFQQSFYVYNPTTKRSRKIIVADTYRDGDPWIAELALAFDPSKSPHYKIVCFRSTSDPDTEINFTCQIEVYDSESRTWKLSLGPFTLPEELDVSPGIYLNGTIYWGGTHQHYYDIAKNEFRSFHLPNYPHIADGVRYSYHLQEANGHLYHSRLVLEGESQSFSLFELQTGDPSSWLLKYHDIIALRKPVSPCMFAQHLIFVKRSYGAETCSVVYYESGKIRAYSFLDKSSKELVDLTGQPFYMDNVERIRFYFDVYEFGECLAVV